MSKQLVLRIITGTDGLLTLLGWIWFTKLRFDLIDLTALAAGISFVIVGLLPITFRWRAIYFLPIVIGIVASVVLAVLDLESSEYDVMLSRLVGIVSAGLLAKLAVSHQPSQA